MLTWQETYEKTQTIAGDNSAATLVQLKSDLNLANRKLHAALNNYFNRRSKATNMVADQQYYQLPPDCVRVIGVDFVLSSDRRQPLTQIRSEYQWRQINYAHQSSNWITYYFVKGADEIGLYPTPSDNLSNGIIIYYEPRGANLSQDDVTTGTVTVTNGSITVTHSGTSFANTMIGRLFKVTDGADAYSYRIGGFTSSSVITLEEPYIGISGSGRTYKIGEAFTFPEEYEDAPMDYALSRFFEMNNNPGRARYHASGDFKNPGRWETAILSAQERYASSSTSMVITDDTSIPNPWIYDNTFEITEL